MRIMKMVLMVMVFIFGIVLFLLLVPNFFQGRF
jgi:hypothetical protein